MDKPQIIIVLDGNGITGIFSDVENVDIVVADTKQGDAWREAIFQPQYVPEAARESLVMLDLANALP